MACGKQYLPAEKVKDEYGTWQAPEEKVAEDKYHKDHTHHDIYDVWSTRTIDLKEFGQGHLLYFYFLKYMAILFGVLSILPALGQMIIYMGGNWYISGNVDKTTLGNFGLMSVNADSSDINALISSSLDNITGLTAYNVDLSLSNSKGADAETATALLYMTDYLNPPVKMSSLNIDKQKTIVAMSVLDLIGCCIYLFFCLYFIWWTKRLAANAEENTVTIHDYSVRVQGVPADVRYDELKAYFEQYGEIVSIELARATNSLMGLVKERKDVVNELELATAVLQRCAAVAPRVDESLELDVLNYKYDLGLINAGIKAQQSKQGSNKVVEVYVTFKEESSKEACMEAQPRSFMRRMMMDRHKRFREQFALKISAAPEPSDIKFENLEFGLLSRSVRFVITLFLKFLLLLIGFILVSLAPAIRRNLGTFKGGADEATCLANCQYMDAHGLLNLNQTLGDHYKACYESSAEGCGNTSICYECYCRDALSSSMYSSTVYCSTFKSVILLQTASQILSVLAIVLVNLIAPRIIFWLTGVEKHHTRSTEAKSTAQALLFMYFLNTSVAIIIANAYLPSLAARIKGSFLSKVLFGGIFSDLTPNWYTQVGVPLIISQFLGIFSRQAVIAAYILWHRYKLSHRNECLTQTTMNKAYEGHEFTLADRYGEQLSVAYICMMFSSGMPLLYWIAAVSFSVSYWIQKYELLKVCKRPISYSADLATYASHSLPFATLWHLGFAFWAFSLYSVPQSKLVSNSILQFLTNSMNSMHGFWENATGLYPDEVARRICQQDAAHLFFSLFIAAVILFLFLTISTWIKWGHALASLFGCIKDKDSTGKIHGAPEFMIAMRSQLLVGPNTYAVQDMPSYEEAFVRMDDMEVDEKLMDKVEQRMQQRGTELSFKALKRRERRRKARLATANGSSGMDDDFGGSGGHREHRHHHRRSKRASLGQVVPEAFPDAEAAQQAEQQQQQQQQEGGERRYSNIEPSTVTAVRAHAPPTQLRMRARVSGEDGTGNQP